MNISVLNQYNEECREALDCTANLGKCFDKVFMDTMQLYMSIPDRINFLQMGRYGKFSEQTYRNNFEKAGFDWFAFNAHLASKILSGKRKAIAIDPSHISKSGHKTPWIGYFWSGVAGAMKRGLEMLGIGLVDADDKDCVALEVPAMDELEQLCIREPAVNQQVVKAETLNDGSPEHLDGVGNFGLKHILLTGVDFLVLAALCLYGGIHHQLSLAVSVAEEHGLEAQDALHHSVRKYLPKPLSLHASFRKVSVIEDDTTGISFCVSPAADEPNELAVDGVDNATPVDTAIVHQAIERVLLAGEEFAQGTVGVVRRCLHGEERQHNKQLHQLNEGELAVRILNRTHRFGLYDEPFHHVVYRVDCPAGVVVLEKVFELRDYLSIFVHG